MGKKNTLKWTKCQKTAQIVEKWQKWGHFEAKWGLGTKKN